MLLQLCFTLNSVIYHYVLSACSEEEEFTCGDGLCIPISKICDNQRNCDDWSDEATVCGKTSEIEKQ